MSDIVIASRSIVSVNHKTNEVVVSKKIVEISVGDSPPAGIQITGLKVDFIQLTSEHIAAKRASLTRPKAGDVMVDIIGIGPQRIGFDYNVGASYVDWSDTSIDGLLAVDDILRLAYLESEA